MNNKRKAQIIKNMPSITEKFFIKYLWKVEKRNAHTQREKYVNIKKYASKLFMRIFNWNEIKKKME